MSKWSKRKKRTEKVYWEIDPETGHLLTHIHVRYYGGTLPRTEGKSKYSLVRTYRKGDYIVLEMKRR